MTEVARDPTVTSLQSQPSTELNRVCGFEVVIRRNHLRSNRGSFDVLRTVS